MYTAVDTRAGRGRSAGQVAYEELKRRLLLGDFPLNRRLGEVALADLLELSRTPVREALARLHTEGLVGRLPEGGYAPAAPDLHTIRELYEVRRGLELTALHAEGGHDRDRLTALLREWRELDATTDRNHSGPDFVLQDEDFHLRLAEAAGNHALVEILAQVNERIRFVRMHDFLTEDRVRRTIAEHVSIAEALVDGDHRTGEILLTRHMGISRSVVERRAALALSRMLSGSREVR